MLEWESGNPGIGDSGSRVILDWESVESVESVAFGHWGIGELGSWDEVEWEQK
jgi:hypothetical protein